MPKSRIAVIGLKGLPALGGTASVGESIIDNLKDRYDFTVYAINSHTDKAHVPQGYRQIVFRRFFIKKLNIFYYYLISSLHALIRGHYDLIHMHLIDGAYTLPILRLRYHVISTSHGRPQEDEKWNFLVQFFFSLNEKLFFLFSNKITCVSSSLIKKYKAVSSRKVVYIPNGILIRNNHIPIQSGDPEPYILFSARRLIPLKGCHLLLGALKSLKYTGRIKIIGDPGQMAEYTKQLKNMASGLNVEFVGLITDKQLLMRYIAQAHLFVFPSLREAMSIMLLEAASTGVPLICSDIPENTAIFEPAEVLYFSSDNEADLAEKIDWALQNRTDMIKKTERAREKLATHYTWPVLSAMYHNEYQEMLNRS
jgi:glycosyltransferase involved in cell wall biosynthesis